jgi:hypothetical protein
MEVDMQVSKRSAILASASAMMMALSPISAVAQDSDDDPKGACVVSVVFMGKRCHIATRDWCTKVYRNLHITTSFFEGYSCEEAKAAGEY